MLVIPSIDLLRGQVVRLRQGSYDDVTVYGDNPVEIAQCYAQAGARRIHIVDLDGARGAASCNAKVIRNLVREVSVDVQVGGGIRNRVSAEQWLKHGAEYVVLGTAAVRAPAVAKELCRDYPGRVVVAIDGRAGKVAIEGWTESTDRPILNFAEEAASWGAGALLYTDIARDGMQEGPNVDATAQVQRRVACPVIASGGVSSIADIEALRGAGTWGVICGKALYTGAFSLAEALEAAGSSSC